MAAAEAVQGWVAVVGLDLVVAVGLDSVVAALGLAAVLGLDSEEAAAEGSGLVEVAVAGAGLVEPAGFVVQPGRRSFLTSTSAAQ